MRKKIICLFVITVLTGCYPKEKKIVYEDLSNKYLITKEATSISQTDTLFTFYDFKNPTKVKMVGFSKNGFRNGSWSYNLKNDIDTIKWGHYKDKYLGFETNVFAFTDSVKYGKWFTKFLYKLKNEKLILSISINGPLKDSLPEVNYDRITKAEITGTGVKIVSFDTRKVINSNRNIYLNTGVFKNANGSTINIYAAHGFIDPDYFVELSVSSENGTSLRFEELFNAVLSNFYIRGKRFYEPLMISN